MNIDDFKTPIVFHATRNTTQNEPAMVYWMENFERFINNDRYDVNITFNYLALKKKNFWDHLFFRKPLCKKEFTLFENFCLVPVKKGSIVNGQPIKNSELWVYLKSSQEEKFFLNNPVEEDGSMFLGCWSPEKVRGYHNFIKIPFSNIVSVSLMEF